MHIKVKYRIIAFCSLVKYYRVDSCIRKNKKCYQLAPEFGMCGNTFSKYFHLCKELGLVVELRSNYQLIALPRIIEKLKLDLDKYCQWTNWDEYQEINFKSIYEKVVQSLIIRNYNQQQHRIDQKEAELDSIFSSGNIEAKNKLMKKVAQKAAKSGMNFTEYVKSMQEDLSRDIVSGKHHVANLIGYASATSGRRWMMKMVDDGVIKREVIKKYTNLPVVHGTFEVLKREKKRLKSSHAIIGTSKGWVLFMGSRIQLASKLDFSIL